MDERENQKAQSHLERSKQRSREYYREHPDKFALYRKRAYQKRREEILARNREYYAEHAEKLRGAAYERRGQNPRVLEARERREFFKGRPWTRNLFWKYKAILSWSQFKELYPRIIDGPCEICGKTGEKMRIDHCHARNVFRGILCHSCNVSIGHFRDDPAILHNAVAYLERGSA